MPAGVASLPPVSPARGGYRGGGEPQTAPDGDHPFDTPFGIMRTMQAELFKLREELNQERQERKDEAKATKAEVQELRELLRKEEAKQQADHERLTKFAEDLAVKEEEDWRTTRRDMQAEFDLRCTVADFKALTSRVDTSFIAAESRISKLTTTLNDLEAQIKANSEGDSEFANAIKRELGEQRGRLDQNALNDQIFEDTVVAHLRMAGQLLQTAGTLERKMAARPPPTAVHATEDDGPIKES
uniref:Uncharacterized protein n=1 Tax=Zooxanthella nutricula TaxID=1333877 RepID=A0A6U8VNG8_9DINO